MLEFLQDVTSGFWIFGDGGMVINPAMCVKYEGATSALNLGNEGTEGY